MPARRRPPRQTSQVLKSYLPILVFAFLGLTVGGAFAMLNHVIGPKQPQRPTAASRRQGEPYECGHPGRAARTTSASGSASTWSRCSSSSSTSRSSSSTRSGVILKGADSVFVLGELITFVVLLLVAFVYVWRKGALDWR